MVGELRPVVELRVSIRGWVPDGAGRARRVGGASGRRVKVGSLLGREKAGGGVVVIVRGAGTTSVRGWNAGEVLGSCGVKVRVPVPQLYWRPMPG